MQPKSNSMQNGYFLIFRVEDNQDTSLIFEEVLSEIIGKYQVMSFCTGESCLNNLYHKPNLIILDFRLPGINGLETVKKIREVDSSIPVVLFTNSRDLQALQHIKSFGIDGIFTKDLEDIEQAGCYIRGIIDKRRKNRKALRDVFGKISSMLLV